VPVKSLPEVPPAVSPRLDEPPRRFRNLHLFALLAAGSIAANLFTNRMVLTDAAYQALLSDRGGSPSQLEQTIAAIRRWESLGILFSPLVLLTRVAFHALLVQLAFLLQATHLPFSRVFRGALWAACVTWLGTAMQAIWLASLPPGALSPELLGSMPGGLTTLFPTLNAAPDELVLLFQQITVFDLGWILVFAVALETGEQAPPGRSLLVVTLVWLTSTLSKWALLLYLSGM